MRRQPPSQEYIARIKYLRGLSIILLLIGLCLVSLYNDYRLLKVNQEKNTLFIANIISEVNNQTVLTLSNFSDFVSQTPAPTDSEKRRFSALVSQQLPYVYTISVASAYLQDELEAVRSPNFVPKQTNQTPDGNVGLRPYEIQPFNFITNFVYPLTPKTEPIIGLDILSLKILDPIFTQVPDDAFVRLLNAPNELHETVTNAFSLFEGGYAISLNQPVGEVVFEDKVYPEHVTAILIELNGFQTFLANFSGDDSLRFKVQTASGQDIWFGDEVTPKWYQIDIQDEQTYRLLGRDITLQSSFGFGLKQINWELMSVLAFLGIGSIIYFNKLYSVIQRKQRNLIEVNTKLTHNLKTQSDMLGYISHELNTPLTLISLANQHLQKGEVSYDMGFHLSTIEKQTEKMTNLVQHILEVKTTQRLSLNPQPHDIIAHIEHIVGQYLDEFAQKHITFTPIDVHLTSLNVDYDQSSLELVLENILSNALKYTEAYEWVELQIHLAVADDDNPRRCLVINVQNAHDGLTPHQCEQIFTKFVRINAEAINGTGLGLGVVKEVCERNEWLVECYSGVKPDVSKQFGKDGYVAFKVSIPL